MNTSLARLATFAVQGHAWHLSVAPELASLVRFDVVANDVGATIAVDLQRPLPLLASVPITQSDNGSSTIVALIASGTGIVALAAHYIAMYALPQPVPFRAVLLPNWVHIAYATPLEASLAVRLLASKGSATQWAGASAPR